MIWRVWSKDDPFGTELTTLRMGEESLEASGFVIGTYAVGQRPAAYRADYTLTTAERFITSQLLVEVRGEGFRRALDLRRLPSGVWRCTTEFEGDVDLPAPGGDIESIRDSLDCDLAFSLLTNTMPILRHRVHETGSASITAAWVSLPDLTFHPERQRYTFVKKSSSTSVVRFESLDDSFEAELLVDANGLLEHYPGIGRRVA